MKNTNAWVSLIVGLVVEGGQWLLSRYADVSLSKYWVGVVDTGGISLVLWVGREGIKGALRRIWNGAKSVYSGASQVSAQVPKE